MTTHDLAAALLPLRASRSAWMAGGFALLWLGLWMAGLPFPNGDDGFFSGAAIHLSQTGQLANPWIMGWMQWIPGVHLDRFYVQLPFPSHALAAWISLFGISTAAMTGYACTVGAAGSTAAAALLVRLGSGVPGAILGGLVVTTYVLHRGLRPEPLGIALLLFGQLLLLVQGRTARLAGVASLLMAPMCHAFLIALAAPLLLLPFWNETTRSGRLAHMGRMAVVGIIIVGLFAMAIRGEFVAFANDFFGHARNVTPAGGEKLSRFFEQLTVGWSFIPNLTIIALCGVLFPHSIRSSPPLRRLTARSALCYGLFVALGVVLYAPFAAIYVVMAAAFVALVWSARATTRMHWLLMAPAAVFVTAECASHGIHFAVNRLAPRTDTAAIARYVAGARPELVLFDSAALRYVFDFRPPESSADLSWCWSPGRSARWWSPQAIEGRDLWVQRVRPDQLPSGSPVSDGAPRIFGRHFGSIRVEDAVMVFAGDELPRAQGEFAFHFARELQPRRSVPSN